MKKSLCESSGIGDVPAINVVFLLASVQNSIMTFLTYCWMNSCPGTRTPTTSVCLKLLGKKYCTDVM